MKLARSLSLFCTLGILAGSLVPAFSALAFIDTNAMEKRLKDIEGELSPEKGLKNITEKLKEAAEKQGGDYLQVTIAGEKVTVWDVKKTDWFYVHVLALMELGIVSGYQKDGKPTGAYGPGDNVTREQALKIALGSAGIDTATCTGSPASSKVSDWAKPYAVCAASMNFGIKAGTDLKAPATRAETLHYVLMAFKAEVPAGDPPFADSKKHMYKNDIAHAQSVGIVSGNPDGTFAPDANVNRAAMAKMAKLAIELL